MLKYDHKMKPVLDHGDGESVGLECPVCLAKVAMLPIDEIEDHEDGSASGRCSRCRAPLKQNPQGFVFLDQ